MSFPVSNFFSWDIIILQPSKNPILSNIQSGTTQVPSSAVNSSTPT